MPEPTIHQVHADLQAAKRSLKEDIEELESDLKTGLGTTNTNLSTQIDQTKADLTARVFGPRDKEAEEQSIATRLKDIEAIARKLNVPFYKSRSFWAGVGSLPAALLLGVGVDTLTGGWAGGVLKEPFVTGYLHQATGVKSAVVQYVSETDDALHSAIEQMIVPAVTEALDPDLKDFGKALTTRMEREITQNQALPAHFQSKLKDVFASKEEASTGPIEVQVFAHGNVVHTEHFQLGQLVPPTITETDCATEEGLNDFDRQHLANSGGSITCLDVQDDGVYKSSDFTTFAFPPDGEFEIEFAIGRRDGGTLNEDEAEKLFTLHNGTKRLDVAYRAELKQSIGDDEVRLVKFRVVNWESPTTDDAEHFPLHTINVNLEELGQEEYIALMYVHTETPQ